ncbi:protein kinase activating protein dpb11 [Neodidymelliopsis sp. IMI 364377]|nr:protein kinase activating protein dpb11 [Neodidymelliopsis sp. IMI 364377]
MSSGLTAVSSQAQLSAIGAQMGATIKLDLTSDVTHLVAGNTDSAKYRYVAKLREDVKVLSPEWLEALRDVWMEGEDDMDLAGLEKQYRLPTFFGLKICLTGFDNPEQRKYIQETVDQNGAEYHGDLTKNVTHLIAAAPTGKKYEHALNWRMKIVSLEWFEQSLQRGMVLEETLFNPTLPTEERGKDAWIRIENTAPALGKRARDAGQGQPLNTLRRKLRRSASTKLGTQRDADALWAGIVTPSFDQAKDDEDEWKEDNLFKQTTPQQNSPAAEEQDNGVSHAIAQVENVTLEPAAPAPPQLPKIGQSEGLFENRIVVTHGFDTNILRDHLEKNGARVLSGDALENAPSDEVRRGYLVIPHDVEVDAVSGSFPGRAGSIGNFVTNWWVERCLYGKRLVDPTHDVLSRPFDKLSINGFSGLTVNSTGFSGIELLHVTKVVTLMADSVRTSRTSGNDESFVGFDGNASLPLQDITANSPRRPSISSTGSNRGNPKSRARSSSAESLIKAAPAARNSKPAREPTPDSVIPAPLDAPIPEPPVPAHEPEEEKDYSDMLSKLRASRKAAPTPADQADEKRRRRRQLGRATSTRSNQSTGDASSAGLGLDAAAEEDDDETVLMNEYQPSQELGWDSPGAAKAREQMIKKLGGTLKERSVPVQAIGGAMDGPSETRVSSRTGRKRRAGF